MTRIPRRKSLDLARRKSQSHALVTRPSGLLLADAGYSYSLGPPQVRQNLSSSPGKGVSLISLRGDLPGGLEILQEFRLSHRQPWLGEQITLFESRLPFLGPQFLALWICAAPGATRFTLNVVLLAKWIRHREGTGFGGMESLR